MNLIQSILSGINYLWPEIVLSFGIILVIIAGFPKPENFRVIKGIAILAILMDIALLLLNSNSKTVGIFENMLLLDNFGLSAKILIATGGLFLVFQVVSGTIFKNQSEFFALMMAVILGSQLLVVSSNAIMIIISLELISISSYVLAGYSFNKKSSEAGMKYFIYGSIATAIMVYGVSWIYGLTGSLNFGVAEFSQPLSGANQRLFITAGLMLMAGILFKMAAAPFHLWAPDVYETAPLPVLALFSTLPKIASAAILVKIVYALNLMSDSKLPWLSISVGLSFVTLLAGNFPALLQKDAKRLMAYSSIGQAGFLMIAVVATSTEIYPIFIFYACAMAMANLLVFYCLQWYEQHYMTTDIQSFSGLGKISVLPAIAISTGLLSLTGIPPTMGFSAKVWLFNNLWLAYKTSHNSLMIWLFVFGLLNTVVALYYYLKIPFYLFYKETPQQKRNNVGITEGLYMILLILAIILFFFKPDLLMGWINKSNFAAS